MDKSHQEKVPPYIYELSRTLRANRTDAEAVLWEILRNRSLNGLKFRRQHPLGRYIADFYCAESSLVIEIDGVHHGFPDQAEYDHIREEELGSRGLNILRFRNQEIMSDPGKALEVIITAVNTSSR